MSARPHNTGASSVSVAQPRPVIPWHLELGRDPGRMAQHQLALEHLGRELVLCFDPPLGATAWSPTRLALVQPGSQLELPPGHTPARSLSLPWPRASLDDLWLLVGTPAGRCWLEVPYGVCRSEDDQRAAPQLGPPRAPPDAGPDDRVLPWQAIRWRLGLVTGWQLAVVARQDRAGELELVARRADAGLPPPIQLTASVSSRPLALEPLEAWGAAPAQFHSARYRFPPRSLGARAYVHLIARSGTAAFDLHVPTSLADRSHRSPGRREVPR
ncbi:MAG TPA: hypothetical protein VNO30_18380 [Kofleriaceae bacterium]|nr:hypothetical protein [Kofleriaceae bacterium]